MWWVSLLGAFSILLVGCAGSTGAASAPRAPAASATPDQFCATAVEAVKAYKAPGQQQTVLENVIYYMAAERRPTQVAGWEPAERASDVCRVTFRATIGNDAQRFHWWYTPKTGNVEADDAATKRISGW